jgi:hypothetical protein
LARQHTVAISHATQIAPATSTAQEIACYARSWPRGQTFGAERFERELAEQRPAARRRRNASSILWTASGNDGDGNGAGIGFHGEPASYKAMRDAVSIAIELQ